MGTKWQHPKLGKFTYDGLDWVAPVKVPAFKAFAYDTGYSNARRSKGVHDLAFEVDDEEETPSDVAVALAERVLKNQKALASKVVEALWEDFNGRGPDSGMWWHGDIAQVVEGLEDAADLDELDDDAEGPDGLAGPKDLLKVMRLSQIRVLRGVDGYKKPVVELSFSAAYEEEHGVGVLTDGESIIGTGYSSDVTPFKKPRGKGRGK